MAKRLFAVEYETETNGRLERFYKAADDFDQQLYQEAQREFTQRQRDLPYPRTRIPTEGRDDKRPVNYGYTFYHQLFNARQLLCLSILWHEILAIEDSHVREFLVVAFSDSLASNNLLCSYAFDYRKLTPLFGLHAFNVISRPVENNVWGANLGRGSFSKCARKMVKGKEYGERAYETKYTANNRPKHVFTGERAVATTTSSKDAWSRGSASSLLMNRSSIELTLLDDKSVDLLLTDPPYFDNLSYSELSDFYFAWLRSVPGIGGVDRNHHTTPYLESLYVFDDVPTSSKRYTSDLSQIFAECRRVLRPNGMMVFTFHHRDVEAWWSLAQAMWSSGLRVTNVFPVRSEGTSGFHSATGTIKWDAVFVCRPGPKFRRTSVSRPRMLWSIKVRQAKWEARLTRASLQYEWPDSLSMGYALAVQQAVNASKSLDNLRLLLDEARIVFHSRLQPHQLKLLRK